LIPAGRIGDRIGHKWVFIVGLAGFTLASLWAGLSNDTATLIVARVVQGLMGGIFFPPVTALIQLMFPPQIRGKAFAIFGASIGFSTALGPLVGGLLIQALGDTNGWRSIFFVNLPFGVVAVIAAFLLLPGGAEARGKSGVDFVGFVLLAGSLVAILVPLIQGQQDGWPLWTYLSMAGGVVLLVVFALWELSVARRSKQPLVPPHLFSHPSFTGGVLLALVYFAAFTSIFFTISIFWQAGLGHTALQSGLVSIPFAIGSIVGASQSNRLAERLGRTVLIIGTALVAIGLISAPACSSRRTRSSSSPRWIAPRRERHPVSSAPCSGSARPSASPSSARCSSAICRTSSVPRRSRQRMPPKPTAPRVLRRSKRPSRRSSTTTSRWALATAPRSLSL